MLPERRLSLALQKIGADVPPLRRRVAKNGVARIGRDRSEHGPSSSDQVIAAIKHGIREGRYVAGQRLIEADLTRDYGLSRGPIREALKRLAGENVVELVPHRGAFISRLSRSQAAELLQVVEVLIILATRLAASRIDESNNRARFDRVYKRLQARRTDGEGVFLAVERTHFYETIVQIAGNEQLHRINPAEQTQLLRLQVQPFLSQQARSQQFIDYAQLAEAIRAGDSLVAERIMRGHTRRARAQLERVPSEAFAPERELAVPAQAIAGRSSRRR